MNKKLLITSALSLSLLGAVAVPSAIFANSDVTSFESTSVTAPHDTVITPQVIGNSFSGKVSGGATVQSAFEVPKGYGHVKLSLKNNSSNPVKVSLTHNDSGKEYISGASISAKGTLVWKSPDKGIADGLRSGSYTLQWRGGDYNVNAEYSGVCGSKTSDL